MAKILLLVREPLLEKTHMKFGLYIARSINKQLVVLYVRGDRPLDELADKELHRVVKRAKREGIEAKLLKSNKNPVTAIVNAAEAIDLVVVNEKRGEGRDLSELNNMIRDLTAKTQIPILINFNRESNLKRPLFCYNGSDKSEAILRTGLLTMGGKVFRRGTVLYVGKDSDKNREMLDIPVRTGKDFEVSLEPVVVEGEPAATILSQVKKNDNDLIILGAYIRGRLQRALSSSVTEDVLAAAKVPVLLA